MNKIQISRIDADGFYLEPVLVTQNEIDRHLDEENDFTLGSVVIEAVPEGLHNPKFDGTAWIEGKADAELLEQARKAKIAELSGKCKEAIVYGFVATDGNGYRLTIEDQINIEGQKDQLKDDTTITSVGWLTINDIEVTKTRDEFFSFRNEAFSHKDNAIWKNKQLREQVKSAATIEEVETIVW